MNAPLSNSGAVRSTVRSTAVSAARALQFVVPPFGGARALPGKLLFRRATSAERRYYERFRESGAVPDTHPVVPG